MTTLCRRLLITVVLVFYTLVRDVIKVWSLVSVSNEICLPLSQTAALELKPYN